MSRRLDLRGRTIGDECSIYVIAEIGINHNGELANALKLIEIAAWAGCDAVKFQKRTPDLCVPEHQRQVRRQTPWGEMSYLEYRHRMEFDRAQFASIDAHCRRLGIHWFASCWDESAVDFIEQFDPVCYKIASASLTDDWLLAHTSSTGRPLLISSGMSTIDEIRHAMSLVDIDRVALMHSTSSYPCANDQLNLRMIPALAEEFCCPIGYSGHEQGTAPSIASVALGAKLIERHITLDRTQWGSDHAASLEPTDLARLVEEIRTIEQALGDGVKRVYASEEPMRAKLRRVA